MTIPRIRNIDTRQISIQETTIPNVYVPNWMTVQPNVDYLIPPVVINIGNPVVDILVSYTHLTLPTKRIV